MSGNAAHTQQAILRGLQDLLDADANAPPLILVGGLQEQLAGDVGIAVAQLRAESESLASRGRVLARSAGRGVPSRDSTPILSDGLT
jgi:hypothetical protein